MKKDKKEIYKINISGFLKRKGLTQKELAEILNCSLGLVGGWASFRCVPSYEKCVELLRAGMYVSELFGEDVAKETRLFSVTEEDPQSKTAEFEKKVGNAIISLINKGAFKVKK